jgi:hypothetical protein
MIFNNASWSQRFVLKANGAPYSLTGKQLAMRIAPKADMPSVVTITTGNSKISIVGDAANGTFDVNLSASDMANFQARTYVFEIGWTNGPNGYTRLFGGRFPVQQGIPS